MKPAFALDFRNDAVSLLHRTTGGWHQVGRVAFDDPDMPAALGYLRSTALGLSPRGVATKLILPDDQILFTTLDAPGPDDAARLSQIRAALEGRTPYPVDELVFDWEDLGGTVRVAVIARESLAEAEAFAAEHRFNPVSFVAAPASGFAAEPWFGPTSHAASLLADGEVVERDGEQVNVVTRVQAETPAVAPEPEPEPEPENVPAPADPVAPEPDLVPEPHLPPEEPHLPDAPLPEDVVGADPEFDALPENQPADLPEDAPEGDFSAQAGDLPPPRQQPLFGLADDEAPPSQAIRAPAPQGPAPRPKERRGQDFWGKPQGASPVAPPPVQSDPRPPADLPPTRQDPMVADEAPMAVDVEEEDAAKPGLPAKPLVTDDAMLDDAPPAPGYSPSMGFASRRASGDLGAGPKLTAAPRPALARPTTAKPLSPAAPRAERPMVNRPTAVNPTAARENKGLRGLGALVGAPGLTGGKKKVQIPQPAQTSQADGSTTGKPAAVAKRASALEKGIGAGRTPVRGKPRHLGLILVAILLLILAVIAAYSTTLAFRSEDMTATEFAAADSALPAPEDEMLADGVMIDEITADEVAPEDATLPLEAEPALSDSAQPAPEVASEDIADSAPNDLPAPQAPEPAESALAGVAATAAVSVADNIVLAAKDPVPTVPSPLDPPEAVAQGDPLPTTQAAPPPFGTVYQFDAKGMIVPTPEGIITPEGVRLVAGKPSRVPPARPAPVASATPDTAAPAPTFADPALAGARPKARPEGLAAPVEVNEAPAIIDNRLVGKRPMARPEAVLAAGEAVNAAKASAAASLAAQAEALAANAPGTPLAVAISRRPAQRPADLSRSVEAAVAAAIREPEPSPEPEPQTTSSAPTIMSSKPPKQTSGRERNEEEADDEPELASAPSGGSKGAVAKQATFKNALNLDKTALIGVYGAPSKRYAMVRTTGGRYKKVKVGDSVDGGRIQAITATEVRYQKGSRLLTLSLPKG